MSIYKNREFRILIISNEFADPPKPWTVDLFAHVEDCEDHQPEHWKHTKNSFGFNSITNISRLNFREKIS